MTKQDFTMDHSGNIEGGSRAFAIGEEFDAFGETWEVVSEVEVRRVARVNALTLGDLFLDAMEGSEFEAAISVIEGGAGASGTIIAFTEVVTELFRAREKHADMPTPHHGIAVLTEERDELWDEIKKKDADRDPEAMRTEATQIAAMAIRFKRDICDGGKHDR